MAIHIAGFPLRVGDQVRQRCAWCGEILLDDDLSSMASTDGSRPYMVFEPNDLIEVNEDPGVRSWSVVAPVDGQLPAGCCAKQPAPPKMRLIKTGHECCEGCRLFFPEEQARADLNGDGPFCPHCVPIPGGIQVCGNLAKDPKNPGLILCCVLPKGHASPHKQNPGDPHAWNWLGGAEIPLGDAVRCETCEGTGRVPPNSTGDYLRINLLRGTITCPACNGSGLLRGVRNARIEAAAAELLSGSLVPPEPLRVVFVPCHECAQPFKCAELGDCAASVAMGKALDNLEQTTRRKLGEEQKAPGSPRLELLPRARAPVPNSESMGIKEGLTPAGTLVECIDAATGERSFRGLIHAMSMSVRKVNDEPPLAEMPSAPIVLDYAGLIDLPDVHTFTLREAQRIGGVDYPAGAEIKMKVTLS